jgi:phosphoribosylaminoimidazole carboxylase PurE protein
MTHTEIAIIMAHEADLRVMRNAAITLDKFGVPYEIHVLSPQFNPNSVVEFAKQAHLRGLKVIIAGAGGAASLPSVVASYTPLPVIGVPIKIKHSIDGLDSIYSILQTPKGLPVATMALNSSTNAALFAMQILGAHHPSYFELVQAYKKNRREKAEAARKELDKKGYQAYYEEHIAPKQDTPLVTVEED